MGKILEKLMKKYWKNAKKILEKSGKFVSPKKWGPCVNIHAESVPEESLI